MSRKSLIITVLALVGLATVAVTVNAGMRSQRGGMGCSCCMDDMMEMGEMEGRGGMQGMEGMGGMGGMGKGEMAQGPLTEGRKEVGEAFTCPVDGMRMTVQENTPATEYRGKTYYFCNEQDKRIFLQDPERYVKRQSTR
jgi:YHS domain-containing protein